MSRLCSRQSYLDEQVAALRRIPFVENPYPLGCQNSRAWSRGHNLVTQLSKAAA